MDQPEEKAINLSQLLVNAAKPLKENEDVGSSVLPIFLGGSEEIHKKITETAIAYLSYNRAKEAKRDKEAQMFLNKFTELQELYFPDLSLDDVGNYASVYFHFSRRYLDRAVIRGGDLIKHEDFINRGMRVKDGEPPVFIPLINPITPKVRPTQTQSERMRRRYFASTPNNPDSFTVVLYNSFIVTKIRRPLRSELIKLINEIELDLRYFGERWVVNSINLERAGIARKIVNFFLGLVQGHSVEGLLSPDELKNYMLANDVNTIALALLQAGSTKGVHYNMTCLANACNHSELVHIDPYDMYLVNDIDMEDDQRDFINAIINTGKQTSVEDILKYQNRYRYAGKPVVTAAKIYENPLEKDTSKANGQFTIKVPTMAEYFTSFDLVAEQYDPTIKKYVLDYPDIKEYRKKRSEFMGSIRMGEYIHWIGNYISYGNPDQEVEDIVEDRSESQREFEKGIMQIFGEDEILYWNVLGRITEATPYMTHTFIGIRNSECPKCHGRPEQPDNQDKNSDFTINTGFTPIDIVTNFFDHTRTLIEEMGEEQRVQEEVIS